MQDMLQALQDALSPWPWAYTLVMLAALLLLAWLANLVTKKVLLRGVRRVLGMLPAVRGDAASPGIRLRVVPRLANVVPALVISAGITLVPGLPVEIALFVRNLCNVFIVFTVVLAIGHAFDHANEIYERRPDARDKPIKGYLQVAKIVLFALAVLSAIAILAGVKLLHVLTGLGAASAVLMLIFQDTILSFAASLQISGDGRVRIGDWIEMPSQNADGDVIDIALHTVTVQNFDKTITTIPTKKLISDSFKNWRGMSESGGRRIKRAIYLDQHSTRFLEPDEVARFRRFRLLDAYLDGKSSEIRDWNDKLAGHGAEPVNRRRVTNLGTFRAYVDQYLRNHPGVHQEMSLMVRQLQPTDAGLPLEIYCFSNDVRWAVYEGIQADIFDHLLAILPEFGLRVFQAHSDAPVDVRLHAAPPPVADERA
ncbi:mechanosensitive ion channel domain-containing protein [Luteimonas sp. MC1572]|uniref:mechanosensitive ion channel family protein n=1 Tax=Luteimonas sp. MC1572 TaxID=2799325 RepID=UPI0018F10585|nr:mechanosensitive ion channel domain-containing protein [Luteimonas sp. MC1572]MBJ6982142.1 mechanosensitive ion channel [Luteimonas sp. MC1572]QQO03430.1 mechanosensitive ion channel [Luteimonas sp. MC1572]